MIWLFWFQIEGWYMKSNCRFEHLFGGVINLFEKLYFRVAINRGSYLNLVFLYIKAKELKMDSSYMELKIQIDFWQFLRLVTY